MKTAWIDRNINLSLADIKDGNLKSILGLFYSLSRYQQQQKAKLRQGQEHPQAKAQPGEATPDNHHLQQGRNTPQLNGGEMLSRFAFMIFCLFLIIGLIFYTTDMFWNACFSIYQTFSAWHFLARHHCM